MFIARRPRERGAALDPAEEAADLGPVRLGPIVFAPPTFAISGIASSVSSTMIGVGAAGADADEVHDSTLGPASLLTDASKSMSFSSSETRSGTALRRSYTTAFCK